MKKHNEGYTLVLVLIVLTVLCILAAAILGFSGQHVANQQNMTKRMQDQYTAAGEIEVLVGWLQALAEESPATVILRETVNAEENTVTLETQEGVSITFAGSVLWDEKKIAVTAKANDMQIHCVLRLVTDNITSNHLLYTLTNFTGVEYLSYEISTAEGGGA